SIIQLLLKCGFEITNPSLEIHDGKSEILKGLQEFREHLGGQLTVMLLADIGMGEEVHDLNFPLLKQASQKLEEYQHLMVDKIKN
ncbi:MAG TPA: hypothetical protein VLS85_01900, partial [Hanamia sp.]|nr:hypothetical protein [Hanamia sp.]